MRKCRAWARGERGVIVESRGASGLGFPNRHRHGLTTVAQQVRSGKALPWRVNTSTRYPGRQKNLTAAQTSNSEGKAAKKVTTSEHPLSLRLASYEYSQKEDDSQLVRKRSARDTQKLCLHRIHKVSKATISEHRHKTQNSTPTPHPRTVKLASRFGPGTRSCSNCSAFLGQGHAKSRASASDKAVQGECSYARKILMLIDVYCSSSHRAQGLHKTLARSKT